MADRTMKRHDTADPITGTATSDDEPSGVDLTVFDVVNFYAKKADGSVLFGGPVTEFNADGTWVYEQEDTDVSEAGEYEMELECVMADGKKAHFPNAKAENPSLQIDEDLDDT